MADFDMTVSGVSVVDWLDPGGATPRLNALDGHPHRRLQATVGTPVVLTAVVGGVSAPLDGALGGRLFEVELVEWPHANLPFTSPAGQSSVQSFTPDRPGHYLARLRRQGGGAVQVPLDAVV